ncbi:hypothetical protein ES288_D05G376200v1 [Gossypium darwinii]|uniref:Pectinesterase inhibitor domain-containing protein n=1 Tax=Gossypium darwinii TaxID=34276 RepID=A0A5D2CNK3_GOSDA|nr:hypothetical protein ES288_D05G376200v1 [Gossypium darwinii]
MASLNVYSVLVVLFLTCGAVMATKENDQIVKENNCETEMGLPYVLEAFTSTFETGSISNKFYKSALVKKTLENPLFKDLSPATIIARSIQTWNNCLALIDSPSLSA